MKEKQLLSVLNELMKNARQSDRAIAQKLNLSQPTVTRARTELEKGYVAGYTAVPSFPKIGYELIAMTFVKTIPGIPPEERAESSQRGREWTRKQPNVVFAAICNGMGTNGVMISFHKNYSDYVEFMRNYKRAWSKTVSFQESIMIYMSDDQLIKPLTFGSLIASEKSDET